MGRLVWVVPMLSVLFCFGDVAGWKELNVHELSTQDEGKRLVLVRTNIGSSFAIRFTCPKPYVVYPRNDESTRADPHVFVEAGGDLVEVPLSQIVYSLNGKPVVNYLEDEKRNVLEIQFPDISFIGRHYVVQIIRRHAKRILFLCALPGMEVSHSLTSKLSCLAMVKDKATTFSIKSDVLAYLVMKNKAIGLASFDISRMKIATHGCGSRETPELLNVAHENEAGVRSCTVDVMEHPDVAFYCDGTIQPAACFEYLFDTETSEQIDVAGHVVVMWSHDNHWLFATYDRKTIKRKVNGYCQCVDDDTGEIKAKITVMTEMSHVCDINGMIFKNKARPIIGNWCDVALLPGSTLTIKLPLNIYDDDITKVGGGKAAEPSRMISYMYPQDMKNYFLDNDDSINDIYPPQLHESSKYILGDALHIDQSRQKDEGIITMTYRENAPLTYPYGIDGLSYTWNLKSNKDILGIADVTAVVKVVPIITHDYVMMGCEPPSSSIFAKPIDRHANRNNLVVYGHEMRLCQAIPTFDSKYGLYCPKGQTFEPRGCYKHLYGESLNSVGDVSEFLWVKKNSFLSNMLIFQNNLAAVTDDAYSKSCSCVDKDGIETARLVLSNNIQQYQYFYGLGQDETMTMIVPSVNVLEKVIKRRTLPEIQEIQFPFTFPEKVTVLSPGTQVHLSCVTGYYGLDVHYVDINGLTKPLLVPWDYDVNVSFTINARSKWKCRELSTYESLLFPLNIGHFFYREIYEGVEKKLVPVEYSEVLGTNTAGFRVEINDSLGDFYNSECVILKNPLSSIVVSKDNDDVINLKYGCGKLKKPYELMEDNPKPVMDSHMGYYKEEESTTTEKESKDMLKEITSFPDLPNHVTRGGASAYYNETLERRALKVFGLINLTLPVTDPYLRGCGINDQSEELFREDTVPLLDEYGGVIGCIVDIAEGDASFYCPLPYRTEPNRCIPGRRKDSWVPSILTRTFRVITPGHKGNRNFYIFRKVKKQKFYPFRENNMEREMFECHCITTTGVRMATIRIYA